MAAVSSYPMSLQYTLQRMIGFSKNTVRVLPQTLTTANPTDTSIWLLPQNQLVDLSSIALKGDLVAIKGAGSTDQVVFPRYSQSFIDLLDVSVNGTSIDASCPYYGRLHKILTDYVEGDKIGQMFNLEMGATFNPAGYALLPGVEYAAATGPFGNATAPGSASSDPNNSSATLNALPWYCAGFQGVLGCGKCLDTSVCGDVRVSLRYAPSTIIAGVGTTSNFTYQIQNLSMLVDVWSLDDGVFYSLLQQRLQSSPISIPFTRFISMTGPSFNSGTSIRWSVTTQSLDALIVTFVSATGYSSKTYSASTSNVPVPYYTHTAAGIGTLQLSANSVYYPAYPMSIAESYYSLLTALGLQDKAFGSVNPNMQGTAVPLGNYLNTYFATAFRFNAGNPDHQNPFSVPGIISGIDCRGLTLAGTVEVVPSTLNSTLASNPLIPYLYAKTTAVLDIGAYRSCALRQ